MLFNYVLKTNFIVVVNKHELDFSLPIINYSKEVINNSIQLIPSGLLFEEGVINKEINVEGSYDFFKTSDTNDIKFDILSSSFYMVSRYEEYLSSDLDVHQRFKAENSLAYKNGFLRIAVVNRWSIELENAIINRFPDYNFPKLSFEFLPTFDIDIAYAYKAKGFKRLIGGGVKSLINGDVHDVSKRIKYILGLESDPFDVYRYITDILSKNELDAVFFFLVGELGKFDKNISLSKIEYQSLINSISEKYKVGLHPSYNSNSDFNVLKSEKENLSKVIGRGVQVSRQHYLKLSFPDTYRDLLKLGIKEDYTMGYASQVGFRAGICTPYPFFDLEKNEQTELIIYPFQVMDGTLNQYLSLNTYDALDSVKGLIEEVKSVEGTFITLWHNETFSEMGEWEGWSAVFEYIVNLVKR